MRKRLAASAGVMFLTFAMLAGPAAATTDGVCFRPVNVPKGDTLNLRAAPNARARLVLALDTSSVVIAKIGKCRSGWCNVSASTGDGTMRGWINRRYLKRSECP